MLLHKNHIKDAINMLTASLDLVDRIERDIEQKEYHYMQRIQLNIRDQIEKLNEFTKYLKKINQHLAMEGSEFQNLTRKIIGNLNEQNQKWIKENMGKLMKNITLIEDQNHTITEYLEKINRDLHDTPEMHILRATIIAIEKQRTNLQTIHDISKSFAKTFKQYKEHLHGEIKILETEEGMTKHLQHNMDSWFV